MLTTPIRAVDERVLPFAPDQIWPVLADVNGYPQWYPPSLHLHVRAVTADGIGSEVECSPGADARFAVAWSRSKRRAGCGGHRAIGGAAGLAVAARQNPLPVHARGSGKLGSRGEAGGFTAKTLLIFCLNLSQPCAASSPGSRLS